jgi:hypothetical protein
MSDSNSTLFAPDLDPIPNLGFGEVVITKARVGWLITVTYKDGTPSEFVTVRSKEYVLREARLLAHEAQQKFLLALATP